MSEKNSAQPQPPSENEQIQRSRQEILIQYSTPEEILLDWKKKIDADIQRQLEDQATSRREQLALKAVQRRLNQAVYFYQQAAQSNRPILYGVALQMCLEYHQRQSLGGVFAKFPSLVEILAAGKSLVDDRWQNFLATLSQEQANEYRVIHQLQQKRASLFLNQATDRSEADYFNFYEALTYFLHMVTEMRSLPKDSQ